MKTRGRWTSDLSLRRYQKPSLIQKQIDKMPENLRKLSTQAAAQIDSYFDDPNLARRALHQHVNIIGPR